jgi:ADP-heptose:LPS heptosyltransferase
VRLGWGDKEEEFADRAWRQMGLIETQDTVALHPGTGSYSPARRWPPERFAAVASALISDGLTPVVVAGPGEEDLAHEVMGAIEGWAALLSGTPTPRHLAALLARCRLFVGNDSGVMHVAVAAAVPVVAVFGPSNHRAWGPYDPGTLSTRVVRADIPCSPCLYRGQSLGLRNGCGDSQCLGVVHPEAVIHAARDLLTRSARLGTGLKRAKLAW